MDTFALLPFIWAGIIAFAVFVYVVLDGFDLGIGILFPFAASDGVITDRETGSVWNVSGEATEGELAGSRLERIAHLDTFWFAWATYQPGTILVDTIE